jgi:type I restriction enzyme S subunit
LDYFKKQVFSRDLSSYKIVRKGEFAYSTIHLDEGALGLLADEEALISPMYTTFEVDASVERQYLAYLLKSPNLINQYGLIGQGSVNRRKSVPFSSLAELEVFIPPLPEQKKIAEILSGIYSNIQTHSTRLRVLQNIQNALFSELPRKEDATEGALLGDIISALNSGWSPVCPPKTRVGEEPAILKTTAIAWEGYRPEENKVLPSELVSKDEAVVKSGDILCTRKGPRDRVGVVCYVSETPPNLMVPDTAFRIRTLEGIDPHYISLVLGSKEVQEEWNRKKVGLAEAQVNINHGILKETFVPLPSREKQLWFVNAITSTRERIKQENSKLRALQVLKSSLSSDLLSGRKRVSF